MRKVLVVGVQLEPLTDKLSGTITASVFEPRLFMYHCVMKILTEEQYLSQNGACRQDIGDPALHKNRGAMSDKTWASIVDAQAEKDWGLIERRRQLRIEYQQKVANGELRPPTRTEQLIEIANGDPLLESVQAARRLLAKRKINL